MSYRGTNPRPLPIGNIGWWIDIAEYSDIGDRIIRALEYLGILIAWNGAIEGNTDILGIDNESE